MLTILRSLIDSMKSWKNTESGKTLKEDDEEFRKKFDQYMDELYKEAKKNERYKNERD